MPKPAPASLELASPYPLPPAFTGGTGGAAYPPPACASPYTPGLTFGACGTAPPPYDAPARGSPYGVGVCPHPPALCEGACCHPPPSYRHHARASRHTVSLSTSSTPRVCVTTVARASVDASDGAPRPRRVTQKMTRRTVRASRPSTRAHPSRRRLLPSTTASTGRLHRARSPSRVVVVCRSNGSIVVDRTRVHDKNISTYPYTPFDYSIGFRLIFERTA